MEYENVSLVLKKIEQDFSVHSNIRQSDINQFIKDINFSIGSAFKIYAKIDRLNIKIKKDENSILGIYFHNHTQSWLETIQLIVKNMPEFFSLKDIYLFTQDLSEAYPKNKHIKDKIRQILQKLRDDGEIVFSSDGNYHVVRKSNNMISIREYYKELDDDQKDVLDWFYDKSYTLDTLPKDMKTDKGNLLVSPAMGIWKSKNIEFATSVKQTIKGPYQDSKPVMDLDGDGTQLLLYHQQDSKTGNIILDKDNLANNIALTTNFQLKIPIGVIIEQKEKHKNRKTYKFYIGMVLGWEAGFFLIQIANKKGLVNITKSLEELEKSFEKVSTDNSDDQKFDVYNVIDARKKQERAIVIRQGQADFRKKVLDAYNHKCAISENNVEEVLEAAHIFPYKGKNTNTINNGILLRSDLHLLFDKKLIRINQDHIVEISPQLVNTVYKKYNGIKLRLPSELKNYPDTNALMSHYYSCEF